MSIQEPNHNLYSDVVSVATKTVNDEVGNESSSEEDQDGLNRNTIQETLKRNRGPRPAYSDANMQHSLGYLP